MCCFGQLEDGLLDDLPFLGINGSFCQFHNVGKISLKCMLGTTNGTSSALSLPRSWRFHGICPPGKWKFPVAFPWLLSAFLLCLKFFMTGTALTLLSLVWLRPVARYSAGECGSSKRWIGLCWESFVRGSDLIAHLQTLLIAFSGFVWVLQISYGLPS